MTAWPRCKHCGGPARPKGKPTLSTRFEVETRSEANARDRWGKIKRSGKARDATTEALAIALGSGQTLSAQGPWFVRLTRVSSGHLDKDNLGRAVKTIQDTVAAALHVDDGDPSVEWAYEQTKDGRFLGVVIEVWSHVDSKRRAKG